MYDGATQTARMTAVRDQIDAGSGAGNIQLLSNDLSVTGGVITLGDPCGTIAGTPAVLTFSGFPRSDTAADNTMAGANRILKARIRDSDNNVRVGPLDVGLTSTAAPAWQATTAYTAGQKVTNGANQYKCVTGGTSAGSGGPTGTGTGITDGTVTWDWYSKASAAVQLDNLEPNVGQQITLASATITHAS